MNFHYHANDLIFKVRPNTTDISIIKEVVVRDTYKISDIEFEGNIVIDIGAHIGSFSVLASSLGAQVLAYEPTSMNFELLRDNIELNESNVAIRNQGVLATSGETTIYIRDKNFGGSSFYHKGNWQEQIQTVTLKDVFDANEIDHCSFLKLDCEGAEFDILNSFPYFDRIKQIALEYEGDIQAQEKIIMILNQNNFKVTWNANEGMGGIYGIQK